MWTLIISYTIKGTINFALDSEYHSKRYNKKVAMKRRILSFIMKSRVIQITRQKKQGLQMIEFNISDFFWSDLAVE